MAGSIAATLLRMSIAIATLAIYPEAEALAVDHSPWFWRRPACSAGRLGLSLRRRLGRLAPDGCARNQDSRLNQAKCFTFRSRIQL